MPPFSLTILLNISLKLFCASLASQLELYDWFFGFVAHNLYQGISVDLGCDKWYCGICQDRGAHCSLTSPGAAPPWELSGLCFPSRLSQAAGRQLFSLLLVAASNRQWIQTTNSCVLELFAKQETIALGRALEARLVFALGPVQKSPFLFFFPVRLLFQPHWLIVVKNLCPGLHLCPFLSLRQALPESLSYPGRAWTW